MDVHAPHHAIEGWKDFFVHLVTISVGLLIAVGIEGCVELHREHKLVQEARATMREEIEHNSAQMKDTVANLKKQSEMMQKNIDALTYRGAAYRRLNKLDLASVDLEEALKLAPNDPDALLERGILRRVRDDRQGAREDWLKLLVTSPDAPAADIARADLEALDVKVEPATPPAKP